MELVFRAVLTVGLATAVTTLPFTVPVWGDLSVLVSCGREDAS